LHPAGAVAGWGFHPLESAAFSRRTPKAAAHGRQKGVNTSGSMADPGNVAAMAPLEQVDRQQAAEAV
jgi:hypothetical protein